MKVPYGIANFGRIRRGGFFYVDKTPFLPLLESADLGYSYLMFLRPRRMGKSTLVSMLEHYYDRSLAGEFDDLFRGLWVHEHPTPERSAYLVLSLDFSSLSSDRDHAAIRESFREVARNAAKSFMTRYRDHVPELEWLDRQLMKCDSAGSILLHLFSIIAGKRERMYVLIDAYDSFADALLPVGGDGKASQAGGHRLEFVRHFYRVIKAATESGAVERLLAIGTSPLLLDDIRDGFNITTDISGHRHFNTLVGFTRADIDRAVKELLANRPDLAGSSAPRAHEVLVDELERRSGRYRFSPDATEEVYDAGPVMSFLREIEAGTVPCPSKADMKAQPRVA